MRSRKRLALPASRWGAYATAATALAAAPAVEGNLHYSGPVHAVFNREFVLHTFPLEEDAGLVFEFAGSPSQYYNLAAFKLTGAAVSSQFRGFQSRGPVSFVGA